MNTYLQPKNVGSFIGSTFCHVLLLLLISMLFIGQVSAQVSPRIRITSNLKDANGSAVSNGVYTITFKIYNSNSGGPELWQEQAQIQVKDGLYSHLLGSISPLNVVNFNTTKYLGVQVGAFELTPRTELTYAPYAVAAKEVVCSGAVGDVKYSLLNPTQFALVNGDCWVPLDGSSVPGSRLSEQFGFGNVPDGSGLFIRAQEFQGGANNDPERTFSSTIASYQNDEVQGHNHTINFQSSHQHSFNDTYQQNTVGYTYGGLVNNGNYPIGSSATTTISRNTNSSTTGISLNNNNGSETRPININVWAYIRIN